MADFQTLNTGPEQRIDAGPSAQEKTTFMPRTRLWQSVREDVPSEGPSSLARGRAPVLVPVALLREKLHPIGRAPAPPADSHGRETVRLPDLQQAVHAFRSPVKALENARIEEIEERGRQRSE